MTIEQNSLHGTDSTRLHGGEEGLEVGERLARAPEAQPVQHRTAAATQDL